MIIGLTHDADGRPRVRRTVTGKVAIGLPPAPGSNFPKRLDHFVFLRKIQNGKEMQWVPDPEVTKHFGDNPREFWIVLMDDDPERAFKTDYAAYVKRGCWCRGDGVKAMRREMSNDGKKWSEFKPYDGPCGEACPNLMDEKNPLPCNPSGDLYFMLAEFPTLGSIWRWHTSSYQSIHQVYSAIQDLRRVTGGRLMGIRAKLFMHPDKNIYTQGGETKSGTKWVVGLELAARDLADMQSKALEAAKAFQAIRLELGGQVLEVEDDDEERGKELTPEFYPAAAIAPAPGTVLPPEQRDPDAPLRQKLTDLMKKHGLSDAMVEQRLGNYAGRLGDLLEKVEAYERQLAANKPRQEPARENKKAEAPQDAAQPAAATPSPAPVRPPQQDPDTVTDADLDFDRATLCMLTVPGAGVCRQPAGHDKAGKPHVLEAAFTEPAPPTPAAPTTQPTPAPPAGPVKQGGFDF